MPNKEIASDEKLINFIIAIHFNRKTIRVKNNHYYFFVNVTFLRVKNKYKRIASVKS